jgi:uncharacterized membrane protein YphA (DoxX/SURF4 family)
VHTLPPLASIGRVAFAVGVAALGGQNLVIGDFLPSLQPVPAWLPARGACAVLVGALLLTTGACIAIDRGRRVASRALALWLWLSVLALHLPLVVSAPRNGGAWAPAFEIIALAGVASSLATPSAATLGRLCYGISLPVFGCLHFLYRDYVASVVPAWIPGPMAWALITGVAHIAAGASLVTGIKARLAATMLGAMFATWVVILHAPRVAHGDRPEEWTSLFVAIAMSGGAWLFTRDRRAHAAGS